ncbi:MAG: ABC transporter permease [Phycisphaerae bacterium]|nr:ABC transporter permease [Phycisphaerae bacterium]
MSGGRGMLDTLTRPSGVRRVLNAAGPLLGLFVIVFGFAVASQVKNGLDEHRLLVQRAERQANLGLDVDPVPSKWALIRQQENRFLSADSLRSTGNQTVSVGIAAMGMTMIIISGGIDLSVGSVMALTSVMAAWCLKEGYSPVPAILASLMLGGLCGLFNATMITRLRVVPFIATLGMWGIARGLAKGLAGEQKIDADASWLGTHVLSRQPVEPLPSWLLVSPGIWTMLLLAAAVWAILRYTALGRHIFAIGSNEATARLCGIRVERTKLYLYALAGLCTGLAGVMQFCRLTVGDPTTAMGAELDVIAAVVIGGGSLSGGEGSVFGSLIGALIMAFLRVGCDQVGVPNWVQEMVIGAVIVLAVAMDQWRHRRMRLAGGAA